MEGLNEKDRRQKVGRDDVAIELILLFPNSSVGKESACNAGDLISIHGSGRPAGEGIGYPLQYFGLENSMDCIGRGVAKSQTQLSSFRFVSFKLFCFLVTFYPLKIVILLKQKNTFSLLFRC